MSTSTLSEFVTEAQVQQFQSDGYCIVADLFSEQELEEIEAFFEDYKTNGGRAFDGGVPYTEIDPKLRQVRAMHPHRYSKKAEKWMMHPKVCAVLEELLGHEPLGAQTCIITNHQARKGRGCTKMISICSPNLTHA